MKILYICTFYHGALIFRDAMDALMRRGHEVIAFNAAVKGSIIAPKFEPIMDDKVIHRECFTKWDRFFFFHKQNKVVKQIYKDVLLSEYQIMHAHTLFSSGYAAYVIHKKEGIPYIVTIRNTDLNLFMKIPMFNILAEKIVRSAKGVQFLSRGYQEDFVNKCIAKKYRGLVRSKSCVIGNGLEEFWLKNKVSQFKKWDRKQIRMICVGTVNRNKNMLTVLRVVDELTKRKYEVKLTIVGDVIDAEVMHKLQQHPKVTVMQFMKKEELVSVYDQSDIYIMPSIHESFGRVYAEAMTRGLPVIYTKGQGFDGLFKDGEVGYSVNPYDYVKMADLTLKILADYENISARCIQNCERFDWDTIGEQLEKFYS